MRTCRVTLLSVDFNVLVQSPSPTPAPFPSSTLTETAPPSQVRPRPLFCGSNTSLTLLLLADFYDAFVSIFRGLFNTRDRAEHTRKRKIVSHTFSPKSVREFEPYISGTVRTLLNKWDALADRAAKDGSGGVMKGYAVMELLDWLNALAFECVLRPSIARRPLIWLFGSIIGDLAFGSTFGMLERDAADIVAITTESGEVIHSGSSSLLSSDDH